MRSSVGMYISPTDSKFTYKAFLSSSLKKVQKLTLIFKSSGIYVITLHACIYPLQHAVMVVFISIRQSIDNNKNQKKKSNFNKSVNLSRNVFNISDNYWRASSSGTITNCFYDLGLSRLGFEHPTFHMQGERSNQLGKLLKYQNTRLIISTWFF